jgi:hypothetical protein
MFDFKRKDQKPTTLMEDLRALNVKFEEVNKYLGALSGKRFDVDEDRPFSGAEVREAEDIWMRRADRIIDKILEEARKIKKSKIRRRT